MGFPNRLKKVRDSNAPLPERVAALCDALTHCHAGFYGGLDELKSRFGWEVGQPVTHEALISMADYLSEQWVLKGRRRDNRDVHKP
jgi:hypothetical protein